VITTKDKNGDVFYDKNAKVEVAVTSTKIIKKKKEMKVKSFQKPDVKDNGDGTYLVEYTPILGENEVKVLVDGQNIKDSPFNISVKKSDDKIEEKKGEINLDPLQSTAEGKGLENFDFAPKKKCTYINYN